MRYEAPTFNHAYTIAFSVVTVQVDPEEVPAAELVKGLLLRLADLVGVDEIHEAVACYGSVIADDGFVTSSQLGARPSWVCDRCSDIQPGGTTPHHYPPNHVCGDCYEVEQDARREGREDDRTGYQRRDGF